MGNHRRLCRRVALPDHAVPARGAEDRDMGDRERSEDSAPLAALASHVSPHRPLPPARTCYACTLRRRTKLSEGDYPHMKRLTLIAVAITAALIVAGCGGSSSGSATDEALSYMPKQAPVVIVV